MRARSRLFLAIVVAPLAGCGSMPDVTVSYYFPSAETQIAMTQTLGCSPKAKGKSRQLRSVITVVPTTVNTSDLAWKEADGKTIRQGHLHYKDLDRWFSDADASVTLTPDGRLSAINTTSAGEGQAIVQNAATAIGAVLAATALAKSADEQVDKACEVVDKFAAIATATGAAAADSKSKASMVTLSYSVSFTYLFPQDPPPESKVDPAVPKIVVDASANPDANYDLKAVDKIMLQPDFVSEPAYRELTQALHEKMQTLLAVQSGVLLDAAKSPTPEKDAVLIDLTRVARVTLQVSGYVGDLSRPSQIWQGTVPVPTHMPYQLPMPRPSLFGKTAFGLALSDSGTITTLHYGANSGQPDVLNALGAVAKALQPKSAADKAAEYQAQADLIAQQQRLVNCQLSPSTCAK